VTVVLATNLPEGLDPYADHVLLISRGTQLSFGLLATFVSGHASLADAVAARLEAYDRHFVRRDLRDFLFWWIGLAAVTLVVAALAGLVGLVLAIFFLWMAYYMFAFLAGPQLLGSVWRTQHQWSRHYLLALPISHWRLFAIQHVRILVFWLPLGIVSAAAPAVPALGWPGASFVIFPVASYSLFSGLGTTPEVGA